MKKAKAKLVPLLAKIRAQAVDRACGCIPLATPTPEPEGDIDEALFCSSREWVEQTEILRDEKL